MIPETNLRFVAERALRDLSESVLLDPAGYPPDFLRSLLRSGAMRVLFHSTSSAGDRLAVVKECAFHSIEMALSLGISVSLFTDPVQRYAPDLWHTRLREEFETDGALGGMMITEPGCGTDLTGIKTLARAIHGGWEIHGIKHWAGLTGLADYWLVLAKDSENGRDRRLPSLNFFLCRADPTSFRLLKKYVSAGLRSIPYGKTEIRAREGVLRPLLDGSSADRFRRIHGILQRSRISIAAIAAGACERMAREIHVHADQRRVFGRRLSSYAQAQVRLAEVESARAIAGALYQVACQETTEADAENREVSGLTANVVKVVSADLAFAAANSASHLLGGESYRTDTYIGRAAADLRPFRIFEGAHDVLCDAIWQAVEKSGKQGGATFADRIASAYEQAGCKAPDLGPFVSVPTFPRSQGLRCLGGQILAQALSLCGCVRQGLPVESCHPLISRMDRNLQLARTRGEQAGLQEY